VSDDSMNQLITASSTEMSIVYGNSLERGSGTKLRAGLHGGMS
jgi:hypothetical protein